MEARAFPNRTIPNVREEGESRGSAEALKRPGLASKRSFRTSGFRPDPIGRVGGWADLREGQGADEIHRSQEVHFADVHAIVAEP